MEQNNFFSTKLLEQAVTRRKQNEDNNQVSWLQIQWLHFEKNEPYKIFYKETLNKDYPFDVINLLPNRKGVPRNLRNIDLTKLYESALPVCDKKKKNMEELFQFIPAVHQQYFKSIIGDGSVQDIGPLEQN